MASSVKVNKITPTTNCGTVTLGDSGDTISIPSGASLNIGGTISGIDGIVNWDTTAKTANFTAVSPNGYFVNTTSAAITVTLPASPSAGDLVAVKDYAFTADTNNITLARNGSNIQGTANDFIINTEGRSVTLIYVDATQGWLLTGASQKSDIVNEQFLCASGGTITTSGDYRFHTFTGPGTFTVNSLGNGCTVPTGGPNAVNYLVVAGGASGGNNVGGGGGASGGNNVGGGGGAGGYRNLCQTVSVTSYPVTIGAGGSASGNNGSPSCVFSNVSAGGGAGGCGAPEAGSAGGSGGGGGHNSAPGGSGNSPPVSPPQGNPGGQGHVFGVNNARGGGGGGASGAGAGGSSTAAGGAGSQWLNCSYYAGGGGGGSIGPPPGGAGGIGGGGAGGSGTTGTSGTVNTGGGGGGGGTSPSPGGAGGSGIVIIRYKFQ